MSDSKTNPPVAFGRINGGVSDGVVGFKILDEFEPFICIRVCPYNKDFSKWWHNIGRRLLAPPPIDAGIRYQAG